MLNDLPLYVDKTKIDMYAGDVTFHTTGTDPKDSENHNQTDPAIILPFELISPTGCTWF